MENPSFDIIKLKKTRSLLSPEEKVFRRLKKKITTLEKTRQKVDKNLDDCLIFYYEKIQPQERMVGKALEERLLEIYKIYKQKNVSKAKRRLCKEFLLKEIRFISNLLGFENVDPQVKEIFQELQGVDYETKVLNDFNSFKDGIEQFAKTAGVDLDLEDVDLDNYQDEIMRKIAESLHASKNAEDHPSFKTKKQIEQELKEKEELEMRSKGLGEIYKRLAKAFHPDLEQNLEKKAEKEILMKKLTNAYEEKDLHTLLTLENTLMKQSRNPAQLKVYNSLLTDQINSLKMEIYHAVRHPKYFPIERFFQQPPYEVSYIKGVLDDLLFLEKEARMQAKDLQGPHAKEAWEHLLYMMQYQPDF